MGQRRSLQGSRILVTGASQGIGRALAVEAAKRGAKVLAAARSEELLRELAAEVRAAGGVIETVAADVTSAEDRQKMVEAARKYFGGLDVLINNAGIGATGHLAEASPERLRKIFEVNFFGLTETTRLFLPLLKEGTNPAIVNISSIAARRGIPGRSEYSASKFAVQGFSEALRAELYKDGIDVLLVNPGLTQTNFSKNMLEQNARVKLDHMRGWTSQDVAVATLRALEKGKNEATFTFKGKLLVFFSRFFPRLVDRIVRWKVKQIFRDDIEERRRQRTQPQSTPPQVPVS
jgi:short-subunit dehydrogenase